MARSNAAKIGPTVIWQSLKRAMHSVRIATSRRRMAGISDGSKHSTPVASNAPIAVKFALEATNKGLETSQSEGLLLEASYFGLCAATEDKNEGTSAFLEKRAPQFHGR